METRLRRAEDQLDSSRAEVARLADHVGDLEGKNSVLQHENDRTKKQVCHAFNTN